MFVAAAAVSKKLRRILIKTLGSFGLVAEAKTIAALELADQVQILVRLPLAWNWMTVSLSTLQRIITTEI